MNSEDTKMRHAIIVGIVFAVTMSGCSGNNTNEQDVALEPSATATIPVPTPSPLPTIALQTNIPNTPTSTREPTNTRTPSATPSATNTWPPMPERPTIPPPTITPRPPEICIAGPDGRLGFHILWGGWDQSIHAIRETGAPALMLHFEGEEKLLHLIDASDMPILRVDATYREGMTVDDWMPGGAWDLIETGAEYARRQGKLLYVIGPNEPVASLELGLFEADRARRTELLGAQAIVGNFSVGATGELGTAWFFSAFDRQQPRILGVHEYGYSAIWTWMAEFQNSAISSYDHTQPLPPIPPVGTEAYLVGRNFRLMPRGWQVVITEFGLDTVNSGDSYLLPDGGQLKGWQDQRLLWQGVADVEMYYAQQLLWGLSFYQQHPQFRAALIFGVGEHFNREFANFDISGRVMDILVESMKQQRAEAVC